MKRWLAVLLLCAGSIVLGDDLEKAKRIHREAIGVDSHIDTLQWVMYQTPTSRSGIRCITSISRACMKAECSLRSTRLVVA